jgi:hypothetical protein
MQSNTLAGEILMTDDFGRPTCSGGMLLRISVARCLRLLAVLLARPACGG